MKEEIDVGIIKFRMLSSVDDKEDESQISEISIVKISKNKYEAYWQGKEDFFPLIEPASQIYDIIEELKGKKRIISNTVPDDVWEIIERERCAKKI